MLFVLISTISLRFRTEVYYETGKLSLLDGHGAATTTAGQYLPNQKLFTSITII